MTARVSALFPAASHSLPPFLIMAGMEASIMTSLGTCRFVMPWSESTMLRRGPVASSASMEARIAPPSGRRPRPARMEARPSSGRRPAAARASPWAAKVLGRAARTAWPKMRGSETFIMVALRWMEKRMSSSLAAATWAARKASRAAADMKVASTTSPAVTGSDSRRTTGSPPSAGMRRICKVPAAGTTTLRSLCRKSPSSMVATRVRESGLHAPIECGWERA